MPRTPLRVWLLWSAVLAACGSDSNPGGPDTTPATVVSVSPTNNATGISLTAEAIVSFSEPVRPATVDTSSVFLQFASYHVPASLSIENGARVVRIHPLASLGNNATYNVTVTERVVDEAGNAPAGSFFSRFATLPASPQTVADPTGDNFGAGAVRIDLTSLSASQGGSGITVVMEFAAAIAPSLAGSPNSLIGYVDLDTDQNPTTGLVAFTDIFGPSAASGLGDEYFLVLFQNGDGTMNVYDANGFSVGAVVPWFFGPTSLTVTLPLALLGGDDGNVNLATVIGTFAEPTDFAPNTGHLTLGVSPVPVAPVPAPPTARPAGGVRVWGR